MGQTFRLEEMPQVVRDDALIDPYMAELDEMRSRVVGFEDLDLSDVLGSIAAISGRLAEMRAQLHRSNTGRATALRTKEVDPLRDELDLQFRVHSRRIALLEWEMRLSGGAV